jgi:hypothetical protein
MVLLYGIFLALEDSCIISVCTRTQWNLAEPEAAIATLLSRSTNISLMTS